MSIGIYQGKSYPLGATPGEDGVNFSVFSRNAEYIELLLFDSVDNPEPSQVIRLGPKMNRTFYYWHAFIR